MLKSYIYEFMVEAYECRVKRCIISRRDCASLRHASAAGFFAKYRIFAAHYKV